MDLLAELGVNRLSVGVQTFNLGLRSVLGRRGGGKEVIKKLNRAREVFPLLTIDILYDVPGQENRDCLLYTSPSPRDLSTSRMPSSA